MKPVIVALALSASAVNACPSDQHSTSIVSPVWSGDMQSVVEAMVTSMQSAMAGWESCCHMPTGGKIDPGIWTDWLLEAGYDVLADEDGIDCSRAALAQGYVDCSRAALEAGHHVLIIDPDAPVGLHALSNLRADDVDTIPIPIILPFGN